MITCQILHRVPHKENEIKILYELRFKRKSNLNEKATKVMSSLQGRPYRGPEGLAPGGLAHKKGPCPIKK